MRTEPTIQNRPSVEAALYAFANADTMEQKSNSLRELMKGGVIHSVGNDPRFVVGIREAVKEIHSTDVSREKLYALSLIARVASRVAAERAKLDQELEVALRISPPRFSLLDDADDRMYAAQTLQLGSGDWVIPYIAQSIVEEETGEKARTELVRILLEKSPDLTSMFEILGDVFVKWQPDTEAAGDSAGRRLKRILFATRKEMLLTEGPAGAFVGQSIDRLVSKAFRNTGLPTSPSVTADVAAEVVAFLHDLVRTRFSVATEGSTYQVVGRLSRWFVGRKWPESVKPSLKLLSRDIEEAVTWLVNAHRSDNELLDALTLVEGSRGAALRITGRIAKNATGLTREIVEWLRRGRVTSRPRENEPLAESGRMNADPTLAQLLIDSRRLVRLLDGPSQDLINDIRVFVPRHEESTLTLLGRARALTEGVKVLAGMRSLRTRGRPGDVVEYSPVEHEGLAESVIGARRVRVVAPLVERVRGDGIADVVLKAWVEPV